MTKERFEQIMEEQFQKCRSLLETKRQEYADKEATEDFFHNFSVAANLQDGRRVAALAGMMAKHTVSVYDMCMLNGTRVPGEEKARTYSPRQWDEKITDHINYLILLRALLHEEEDWDGQEQRRREKLAREDTMKRLDMFSDATGHLTKMLTDVPEEDDTSESF